MYVWSMYQSKLVNAEHCTIKIVEKGWTKNFLDHIFFCSMLCVWYFVFWNTGIDLQFSNIIFIMLYLFVYMWSSKLWVHIHALLMYMVFNSKWQWTECAWSSEWVYNSDSNGEHWGPVSYKPTVSTVHGCSSSSNLDWFEHAHIYSEYAASSSQHLL